MLNKLTGHGININVSKIRMHAYQHEEKVLELFPGRNYETGQWTVVPDLSRTFLEPTSNVPEMFWTRMMMIPSVDTLDNIFQWITAVCTNKNSLPSGKWKHQKRWEKIQEAKKTSPTSMSARTE
jgi:hypothetical protein